MTKPTDASVRELLEQHKRMFPGATTVQLGSPKHFAMQMRPVLESHLARGELLRECLDDFDGLVLAYKSRALKAKSQGDTIAQDWLERCVELATRKAALLRAHLEPDDAAS